MQCILGLYVLQRNIQCFIYYNVICNPGPQNLKVLKGYSSPKWTFCHYSLHSSSQCYFHSNQSVYTRRIHILTLRRMQKSVRCMCLIGNMQNGTTLTRMRGDLIKVIIFIFFAYKKYSRRFIKFRLNHWCRWTSLAMLSFFSGPQQWYLLSSQRDSHKSRF